MLLFWGFARVIWSGAAQREGWGRARRHPGDGDVSTSSTGGRARARGAQLTEASRTRADSRGPQRTHVGLGFVGAATRRVWVHAPSRGSPRGNDPSAGSPTETLLRLHLPLNDKVYLTFHGRAATRTIPATIREVHRTIQSVGATGGVYKGQGRNQCKLMTCAY